MSASSRSSTRERGRAVERAVAEFLVARGLTILDRNYESAGAEVDLVASEPAAEGPATIVFVEVRSRRSSRHGSPLETIDARKQRRIIRAATAWLVGHDLWERAPVRFDVVAVTSGAAPEWVRGAFEA